VTFLIPAINRKLCGKLYASFQLAVKVAQMEEQLLVETVVKPEGKHQGHKEQKKGE